MNLEAVDLNLLVSLGHLLEHRNVSMAALRAGVSQSTMSYRLNQLRKVLDDPLLVRAGREMTRTPLADALLPRVNKALAASRDVFSATAEVVESPDRLSHRIATTDFEGIVLLERYSERFGEGTDLRVVFPGWTTYERLAKGFYDLLVIPELGPSLPLPDEVIRKMADMRCEVLFEDRWVAVVHRRSSLATRPVTPMAFAEADHVLLTILEHERSVVDDVLEAMGLNRRVALTVPTFIQAYRAALEMNMVAILPRSFAQRMGDARAVLIEAPIPAPPLRVCMYWHPHLDEVDRHQLLRARMRAIASEVSQLGA
ncbi:MAG: LysR family transcriptional regulator [Proteobacteria bacterium]|nr:LysR family transcriptional regulator [Pseudomonadota bacterium]